MVLSNKKLKQKLRAALTESLAAKEAEKQGPGAAKSDLNLHQTQTLKQLLSSTTQKLRLSKREIRRKNPPLKNPAPSQKSNDAQNENTSVASSGNKENKKNKKKRKRVDDQDKETGDGGNELMAENPPKKKKAEKKKERKKKKKTKGKEKEKREEENRDGASKAEVEMGDSSKMEKSQEIGDVPTKVYVGGIPYYSTEDDIRSFFDSCGTITEVDCMKFPESGKFRGIAMITFKTEAAAKRALALDGADMGGLFLKVKPFKNTRATKSDFKPELVEGYNRIYVGNLSWDITEDDLKMTFVDCNVSSIRFGMDKTTGEFRGYAHVDFHDGPSLTKALALDQKVVCGRPMRISCAVPKKEQEIHIGSEAPASSKSEKDTSSGNVKKKRRTCYVCGIPGHLSSSCPQKQAVEVENSTGGS